MSFLVDSNVLSEQTKPLPHQRALAWLDENDPNIVLNPIILGEIEFGIRTLAAGHRRTTLLKWFRAGVQLLPVLPIDALTAVSWAALLTELHRKGRTMPVKDSLIAASARQHGLVVATRNVADYKYAGVELVHCQS